MKIIKNCCPYCGSEDITIDVDITVSAHFENGTLFLDEKRFGTYRDAIDEAIQGAGYDQMRGFCYDCGADFGVDHIDDAGVYFRKSENFDDLTDDEREKVTAIVNKMMGK